MKNKIKEFLFRRKTELLKQSQDGRRKKPIDPKELVARMDEIDELWSAIDDLMPSASASPTTVTVSPMVYASNAKNHVPKTELFGDPFLDDIPAGAPADVLNPS